MLWSQSHPIFLFSPPHPLTFPLRSLISAVEHMPALEPGTTSGQISVSSLCGLAADHVTIHSGQDSTQCWYEPSSGCCGALSMVSNAVSLAQDVPFHIEARIT